jgi:nucleoside-diphosphate-sugar epimerase
MIQADLTCSENVARLVREVDAVVHCAIGTESWDRTSVFKVTVDGTRGLLDAAKSAGVKRFAHLSTIAVHPDDYRGIIDENAPVSPARGATYGESKLAAEQAVLKSGLPCVVFRPGCVYGPYGKTFITRPIEYLMRGGLVLAGAAETPSNTVYVDNLVEAIIRSLEAGDEAVGRIFSLADDDGMTWGDFYDYFAHRAGATVRRTDGPSAGGQELAKPGWFGAFGTLADPIGSTPRWLLSRSPALKKTVKRMLRMQSAAVYVRPERGGASDVLEITPRFAEVKSDLARKVLGWQPLLDRMTCLGRTYQWLQASQIVPASDAGGRS